MYRILIVDDEPAALSHVCMILNKKCPQYEIMGTALNGAEALEAIRKEKPDIVISDVRMPVMDGIQLVSRVKEEYPEILSIIVSGYSEFEYAKGALQSGVCDYLLKPLAPSDMKNLLDKLEVRLNRLYYEKRNTLLKALCNGQEINESINLDRYFTAGRYYVVMCRKNGLPRRFSRRAGVEIFSMEEEKVYIYGRDEMEELYLVQEELLLEGGILEMAERIFEKEKNGYTYLTEIVGEEAFTLGEFPEIVKRLYRRLDESIVIGKNQLRKLTEEEKIQSTPEEKHQMEQVEGLIRFKETQRLPEELQRLFSIWCRQNNSQIYVEAAVKYMLQLIHNMYPSDINFVDLEFMLDDAFYYALDMQELKENILAVVKQCIQGSGKEKMDNKEQLFYTILSYLNQHLEETMTLGSICKEFGLSQASLSRMFRCYEETSFSNYLTKIRIEKAQIIMKSNPEAYIRDVADCCGYSDQFYFSRIFRSVTGMCPKEYAERVRQK